MPLSSGIRTPEERIAFRRRCLRMAGVVGLAALAGTALVAAPAQADHEPGHVLVSLSGSNFEIDDGCEPHDRPRRSLDRLGRPSPRSSKADLDQRRRRRLVRSRLEGGHRGTHGRRRQHPAEQERPDERSASTSRRPQATTSCTSSGTASRTRRARRTWTSSSIRTRRTRSWATASPRAHCRRPADPVRPRQRRYASRAVPLGMGHDRQQVPVRGREQHSLLG